MKVVIATVLLAAAVMVANASLAEDAEPVAPAASADIVASDPDPCAAVYGAPEGSPAGQAAGDPRALPADPSCAPATIGAGNPAPATPAAPVAVAPVAIQPIVVGHPPRNLTGGGIYHR